MSTLSSSGQCPLHRNTTTAVSFLKVFLVWVFSFFFPEEEETHKRLRQ